ncbi:MAG: hypothetical protein R3A80_11520 [Bdellovibrionota bacterium]
MKNCYCASQQWCNIWALKINSIGMFFVVFLYRRNAVGIFVNKSEQQQDAYEEQFSFGALN